MSECCANCRFATDSYPMVYCRRNPPVILQGNGEARFPYIHNSEWCGEWKANLVEREK